MLSIEILSDSTRIVDPLPCSAKLSYALFTANLASPNCLSRYSPTFSSSIFPQNLVGVLPKIDPASFSTARSRPAIS